jgi:hypothetical protein
MSFLVGRTLLHEFILRLSKSSTSLWDEKKLSINILCHKPSTLQVKCLAVTCVAFKTSVAALVLVSTQVHSPSGFGGLGVSMLASGTHVRGFESGMPPFGGEVKHVKDTFK